MWIIEMRKKSLGPKWFKIWDSEVADEPEKRGPAYCAEYLKCCVESEKYNQSIGKGKEREYRMLYIPK